MTGEQTGTKAREPRNVVEALARVQAELPGIGKDQNSQQGYKYRGIEQITSEAQRLLGKHGVVFAPHVRGRTVERLTVNGKPWTQDELEVTYTVYGPGGVEDCIEVGPIYGLGRDNSDKGSNKALTQAFKYALLQTLCISDAKDDGDQQTHETEAFVERAQSKPEPTFTTYQLAVKKRMAELSEENNATIRKWRKDQGYPGLPELSDEQCNAVLDRIGELEETGA